MIACLADIIKCNRAAGRGRDLAVIEILEMALDEQEKLSEETLSPVGPAKGKRPSAGRTDSLPLSAANEQADAFSARASSERRIALVMPNNNCSRRSYAMSGIGVVQQTLQSGRELIRKTCRPGGVDEPHLDHVEQMDAILETV